MMRSASLDIRLRLCTPGFVNEWNPKKGPESTSSRTALLHVHPRLRCLTAVVDEQTMAQDIHHVGVPAVLAVLASMQAKGQRVSRQKRGRAWQLVFAAGGRWAGFSRPGCPTRTPLLQLAWLLVSWLVGLVLTIDLRPCEAASHHVGRLTQTQPSRLPSLGRAGRPMLGLTLRSITRRGSMCPSPCPPTPTCHNLP